MEELLEKFKGVKVQIKMHAPGMPETKVVQDGKISAYFGKGEKIEMVIEGENGLIINATFEK